MRVRFYLTSSGRSPVEEFLGAQSETVRHEFVDALNLLAEGKSLSMPLDRNLSSIAPNLQELRFRDRAGQVRVIYFIKKRDSIYFIHAFRKKTQEIPRQELEVIKKRLKEI